MITVLRVAGFANGDECPIVGQYLQAFDHEANGGIGFGLFTNNKKKAMQFQNMKAAIDFWQKIPECFPIRDDGMPNRPLTCTTVEFLRF